MSSNDIKQCNLLKNKSLKKVRFYGIVYVILIPSITDYIESSLIDKLWWSKRDLKNFQSNKLSSMNKLSNNNNNSLKDYCLNMLQIKQTNQTNPVNQTNNNNNNYCY